MTDDDRKEIDAILSANLDAIWTEFREQSARMSAIRFGLEDLYADAYAGRAGDFSERMQHLLQLTRDAPVKGDPMQRDALEDLKVRTATHLERLRAAVAARIEARSR